MLRKEETGHGQGRGNFKDQFWVAKNSLLRFVFKLAYAQCRLFPFALAKLRVVEERSRSRSGKAGSCSS